MSINDERPVDDSNEDTSNGVDEEGDFPEATLSDIPIDVEHDIMHEPPIQAERRIF